ncbi:CAP domain-containing protein [Rubellimicrobium rubrum]|uniref:CAP domain-containing protein n=1 Tax=Rubellimicrobium rubrum TaxID=2585369 RepID=A0A5C4MW78_9RHOB|nr:CAP domain-containing protein [Rubellimicrobium rubrum]TNC48140.1 CAP domain-containing protein [Rubellimicrobium rubrum]
MQRRAVMAGLALMGLSACGGGRPARPLVGADGLPLPTFYRITPEMEAEIGYRMADSVNSLRQAAGAAPVTLDPALTAAAATHSRDMAVQNRPWHFGSDGSSPVDRLQRVGYRGTLVGEVISETYEDELQTLSAWMQDPQTRDVILNRSANRLGLAWFQEESGKIWWTMVLAA